MVSSIRVDVSLERLTVECGYAILDEPKDWVEGEVV
jgi:hypothetical protein